MTKLSTLIDTHNSEVYLNCDHFAERIILHTSAGDKKPLVLVDVDEPIRDTSGTFPTVYTGTIWIDSGQRPQWIAETNAALTVTARGFTWDVVDVGEAENGMCNIGIRREIPEHSNAIDLQGTQHRYG